MRILVDTNVIIHLEDDHQLESAYSSFSRLASKNNTLVVHPLSKDDIQRNGNSNRRMKTLSKMGKYPVLEQPPVPDGQFMADAGFSSEGHDAIDASMLYALYGQAVHFLVTQDMGIHRKAQRMGIDENVLTVEQAVSVFERLTKRIVPRHTLLENIPVHNLDFNDPFFDSLREDYGEEFNGWFKKICGEGRMCWAYREKGGLLALCIYKEESVRDVDSVRIIAPALKLCTFKVDQSVSGKKLAELMLKLVFNYANENRLASVYLTILPKYTGPLLFFEENGFHRVDNKGDEIVLLKAMKPPPDLPPGYDVLDRFSVDFYPHYYESPQIQKYIVPIQPEFHDRLFPDCTGTQRRLTDYSQPSPDGNTIKKAYICNAKTKQIRKGDLLLFYRSKDRMEITSIGVVERVMRSSDPNKIAAMVGNRTVYTYDEIKNKARGEALVLIFRHMRNLKKPVSASDLRGFKVRGPIQSIRKIAESIYRKILEEGSGSVRDYFS